MDVQTGVVHHPLLFFTFCRKYILWNLSNPIIVRCRCFVKNLSRFSLEPFCQSIRFHLCSCFMDHLVDLSALQFIGLRKISNIDFFCFVHQLVLDPQPYGSNSAALVLSCSNNCCLAQLFSFQLFFFCNKSFLFLQDTLHLTLTSLASFELFVLIFCFNGSETRLPCSS